MSSIVEYQSTVLFLIKLYYKRYLYLARFTTTSLKGKNNQQVLLTTKVSNLRTKEANRKSRIGKERDMKVINNKASKSIQKQNAVRATLIDLTSAATEMKKLGNSHTNSPMFMTTIDSDGIKSVTSASGTHKQFNI